ncbi:MAG: hypothetical protein MH204_10805, partial [Fimbriimonadaceae bacterium]|nr:hypothetical protein [Fimbriimonadaceae bacterium]
MAALLVLGAGCGGPAAQEESAAVPPPAPAGVTNGRIWITADRAIPAGASLRSSEYIPSGEALRIEWEKGGRRGETWVRTDPDQNEPVILPGGSPSAWGAFLAAGEAAWVGHDLAGAIRLDGPAEDRATLDFLTLRLSRAVEPGNPKGLRPLGPTSDRYPGVFWDADVWVFPALALLDPGRARAVPEFRLRTESAARALASQLGEEGLPRLGEERRRGRPVWTPGEPIRVLDAIRYPWTAAEDGSESAPGDERSQEHVTASVVLGLEWAAALGLADPDRVNRIRRAAGNWYRLRSEPTVGGERSLQGVMGPDESWTGDDDLYTNMAAERLVQAVDPQARFRLPRDGTTFLTHPGDTFQGYKQASALLTLFPLQDPRAEAESAAMLDRFVGKSTWSGPAMSRSLEALLEWAFGSGAQA